MKRIAPVRLVLVSLIIMSLAPGAALAWDPFRAPNDDVLKGNAHLEKGQVQEALSAYNEAAKRLPNEPGVHLDRGLALLKAGKLPEAREALRMATQGDASPAIRGQANYNLGLAFMQEAEAAAKQEQGDEAQKLLRESADAFKGSLRANPGNRDAAWNYELAKRRLVEQQKKDQEKKEQEKKEQEEQEKKEQEKGDQKPEGDDEKQGDQGNDDKQGDEDAGAPKPDEPEGQDAGGQEPDQKQPDQKQPEPEQPEPQQPNEAQPAMPEHMQKALDALENSEENLQKHRAAQQARQRPRRIEKDW